MRGGAAEIAAAVNTGVKRGHETPNDPLLMDLIDNLCVSPRAASRAKSSAKVLGIGAKRVLSLPKSVVAAGGIEKYGFRNSPAQSAATRAHAAPTPTQVELAPVAEPAPDDAPRGVHGDHRRRGARRDQGHHAARPQPVGVRLPAHARRRQPDDLLRPARRRPGAAAARRVHADGGRGVPEVWAHAVPPARLLRLARGPRQREGGPRRVRGGDAAEGGRRHARVPVHRLLRRRPHPRPRRPRRVGDGHPDGQARPVHRVRRLRPEPHDPGDHRRRLLRPRGQLGGADDPRPRAVHRRQDQPRHRAVGGGHDGQQGLLRQGLVHRRVPRRGARALRPELPPAVRGLQLERRLPAARRVPRELPHVQRRHPGHRLRRRRRRPRRDQDPEAGGDRPRRRGAPPPLPLPRRGLRQPRRRLAPHQRGEGAGGRRRVHQLARPHLEERRQRRHVQE